METHLDSVEFCISSCLSRMVKIEVWMRKVQDKMDGVVPEVIDLTSEDGEGKEAIGDVLRSPFLDLGPLDRSCHEPSYFYSFSSLLIKPLILTFLSPVIDR